MCGLSRGPAPLAVPGRATRLTGCDTAPHDRGRDLGHHSPMPRSSAQSDFVVGPAPVELDASEPLPDGADGAALPVAVVRTSRASERTTRWVMRLTWFMLAVLALICAIGPHIPSGE
jgi:hypothetical protein